MAKKAKQEEAIRKVLPAFESLQTEVAMVNNKEVPCFKAMNGEGELV